MKGVYSPQRALSHLSPDASSLWRLVVGLIVIELIWTLSAPIWPFEQMTTGLGGGPSVFAALMNLMLFIIMTASVAFVVNRLQDRSLLSLIGPLGQAWDDFWSVIKWTGGIAFGLQMWWTVPYLDQVEVTRDFALWLLLLPVSALAVLIQTSAEELQFRGFVQSSLAARFQSPWVWMALPSFLFGLIHIPNAESTPEAFQIVIYITAFAMAAADLTARSGTLGAAMAVHFINNATLFLLAGELGNQNSGLALWLFPAPPPEVLAMAEEMPIFSADLMIWMVTLLIYWLSARVAIRR